MNVFQPLRVDAVTAPETTPALSECVARAVRRYLAHSGGDCAQDLYRLVLAEVEAPMLRETLRHTDGNLTRAAARQHREERWGYWCEFSQKFIGDSFPSYNAAVDALYDRFVLELDAVQNAKVRMSAPASRSRCICRCSRNSRPAGLRSRWRSACTACRATRC